MAARLHKASVSVMYSSLLQNLTAATRLQLLSNEPSSVKIDAVVTILEACIASRLASKESSRRSRLLWTRGDARIVLKAFELKSPVAS